MSLITKVVFSVKILSGCVSRMSGVVQPCCSVCSAWMSLHVWGWGSLRQNVCVCSGCVLLAFPCWGGLSMWHEELVTCQDKMIKGPFKTWLFCMVLHSQLLLSDVLGWMCWLCHCWEAEVAEVLRTTAWSCSGLQMFSCEIVSEGRSGKLQSFLCLYLVLLAGVNIQDQGSLRALCFWACF